MSIVSFNQDELVQVIDSRIRIVVTQMLNRAFGGALPEEPEATPADLASGEWEPEEPQLNGAHLNGTARPKLTKRKQRDASREQRRKAITQRGVGKLVQRGKVLNVMPRNRERRRAVFEHLIDVLRAADGTLASKQFLVQTGLRDGLFAEARKTLQRDKVIRIEGVKSGATYHLDTERADKWLEENKQPASE